ncbi:carbohydrate ABC transporter permease [Kribbella sp. NPDC051586]|uniref:carbohydrate ABC transporter permease n=1 Tax=Kribbella sp. NPDC051586 TaxID=3364118 RepID=UPI0037B73FE6
MNRTAGSARISAHAALVVVSIISVVPLVWVLLQSVRTSNATSLDPFAFEWPPVLRNYLTAWNQAHFSQYVLNSAIVAAGTVALVLAVAFPAAYALTVLKLRLTSAVFYTFLLGLMIPVWSVVIPLFFQMRNMGLINTRIGAVLVETAMGIPFAIFLLRASLRDLPRELVEAARIDGAGELRTLWSIVRPAVRPALQAVVILQFMTSWNELVVPLFFLQTDDVRTLPIGLTFFQGRFTTDTSVLAAGTTLAALPVLIIYVVLNRQFIQGLTAGAAK